jgi:hypothetical protein
LTLTASGSPVARPLALSTRFDRHISIGELLAVQRHPDVVEDEKDLAMLVDVGGRPDATERPSASST